MGTFFGTKKPMVMSEFQHFKVLTPFVTSLTPNCTQKGPKLTRIGKFERTYHFNDPYTTG